MTGKGLLRIWIGLVFLAISLAIGPFIRWDAYALILILIAAFLIFEPYILRLLPGTESNLRYYLRENRRSLKKQTIVGIFLVVSAVIGLAMMSYYFEKISHSMSIAGYDFMGLIALSLGCLLILGITYVLIGFFLWAAGLGIDRFPR
jgi:hypothetical protein